MGHCRPGRNLHFELLTLLLENHEPQAVFIEINQDEDWYGHFDFGNVATTSQVIQSYNDKNPKFLRDLKLNFIMKYDLFQRSLLNRPYTGEFCESGYIHNGGNAKDLIPSTSADTNTLNQRFTSERYLQKMVDLCAKKNVKVFFHYLPALGLTDYSPHYIDFYNKRGTIISPPDTLKNNELWGDASHLNFKGAEIYTTHLSNQIHIEELHLN